MSKLHVDVDYIKIAQWLEVVKTYIGKIEDELSDAALRTKREENEKANTHVG